MQESWQRVGCRQARERLSPPHKPYHPRNRVAAIGGLQLPLHDIACAERRLFGLRHLVIETVLAPGLVQPLPSFALEAMSYEESGFLASVTMGHREEIAVIFSSGISAWSEFGNLTLTCSVPSATAPEPVPPLAQICHVTP